MRDPSHLQSWGKSRGNRLPTAYPRSQPIHVIICTWRAHPVFTDRPLATSVFALVAEETATVAACLMPDHLHWLLRDSSKSLEIVRGFKSYSAHLAWKRGVKGKLWQRSFWDHVIRSNDKLGTVAGYIAQNPVRAGLVTDARNYPYQTIRF